MAGSALAELSEKFDVHFSQIVQWKVQGQAGAGRAQVDRSVYQQFDTL
jgi:hypothetical protein